MLKRTTLLILAAASTACTQLPRAEFQAYRDAVQAAHTAAVPMLESYAVREREATLVDLRQGRNFETFGFFDRFVPSDVVAGSSLGLPPGADATDRAFRAITGYGETLAALAENRNIGEARAQLQQITADLTGIAPQLLPAQAPIKAVGDLLVRLLTPAIQEDNRQQFRRIVLDGYPRVVELIGILRRLTGPQYTLITEPMRARWRASDEPTQQALAAEINGWHRVFSDYVFLLNAMEVRLGDLREAVANPRSQPLLARASAGAADLRVYAEGLRQSMAALRAPR